MNKEEITALRLRLNLTQTQLAYRIGVNQLTVNRWENGRQKPSNLALKQLEELDKTPGRIKGAKQ